MSGQISLVPMERIERAIILLRGQKVMLDSDLSSSAAWGEFRLEPSCP